MNVILIPGRIAKGRHISLSPGQVWLLALVLLVAMPVLIGVVTFQIQTLMQTSLALQAPDYVRSEEQHLIHERENLAQARRETQAHLDALTQKLGTMQAQLARLNALGSRLATQARLDTREFNFSQTPGVGGPEEPMSDATVPQIKASLDQLSARIDAKTAGLRRLEDVLLDREARAAVTPRGWPVKGGWISSGFGQRADPFTGKIAFHEGVDIADRLGSPIHAIAAGVVTYAGPREGYGLMVEIYHGHGLSTRYAHARALLVKVGEKVQRGQEIALLGSTGRSTGPHVHIEVLRFGRRVDPMPYLHQQS